MTADIAYTTSAGGRQANQDSLGYAQVKDAYCFVVADGVGGYHHGEYASQLAVQRMKEEFVTAPAVSENTLQLHMQTTAHRILEDIDKNPALHDMRTTLAAVYLDNHNIIAGHIGDSRIYIFHACEMLYCSQDHSLVMEMAQSGELPMDEIRRHPKRNVITSAIGRIPPKKVDITAFSRLPHAENAILLCTDGFWELIGEDEISALLKESDTAQQWLCLMEQRVGNRQSGRSDNYTCLVARTRG